MQGQDVRCQKSSATAIKVLEVLNIGECFNIEGSNLV